MRSGEARRARSSCGHAWSEALQARESGDRVYTGNGERKRLVRRGGVQLAGGDGSERSRGAGLEALVGQLGKLGRKEERDQLRVKKPTKPLWLFVGRAKECPEGGEKKREGSRR